jgi:hypothetical protein
MNYTIDHRLFPFKARRFKLKKIDSILKYCGGDAAAATELNRTGSLILN